jgi:outer membrane protein assembly factor BamB
MHPSLRLLSVLGLVGALALEAANWPEFRGPDHQGVSKDRGFPVSWNATNGVLWKTEIPGEGWSTPAVWGKRVFVTTTTASGAVCHVLALDAKSGKVLWDREVFQQVPRRKEGRNSYATPSPCTDGKRVYAVFGDGSAVALDFQGRAVWTNRAMEFYSQHGLGSSPILVDGLLVMARDGSSDGADKKVGWQTPWESSYVVALDAKTGRERWRTGRGLSRISHGTPTLATVDGRKVVVTEAGDVVQGFDLLTGKLLWTDRVPGEGKVPSPIVADGLVFASGGWGGRESIQAFPLASAEGVSNTRRIWEQKRGNPKVPSMITLGGRIYSVTDAGMATALDAKTGEVLWQERIGGNHSASPVSAEGRIYFFGDNAETTVLEAGPQFRVLSRNPLEGKVQASPALADGRIYLRTDRHLYCVGRR